jgi:predicted Zn-dependent peptidase
MRKFVFLTVVLAGALLGGSTSTSAQSFDVKTTTLKNGMKVMVQEDHTIPFVNLYIFYRIGSRNERPGTTGISHFFEHMMFNGAKKYGPGQLDSTMENGGGENNAYTSYDVTVYKDWFPPPALETIFDIEADTFATSLSIRRSSSPNVASSIPSAGRPLTTATRAFWTNNSGRRRS